jgi:mannan endo-1,4-beta-mannosidase
MEHQPGYWMVRTYTKSNMLPPYVIPSFSVRVWRDFCLVVLTTIVFVNDMAAQTSGFVGRSNDTLRLDNRPYYFLGANAYYLMEQAARGDTQTVKALFRTAQSTGMTVVRTWGFFDSPDSLNPAVVQYRPGVFSEQALRALDYVISQARFHNIRLLIPLVNSWDEYGGMNQYVRWRSEIVAPTIRPTLPFSETDQQRSIEGGNGRSYRFAITSQFGHDDFYSDPIIKTWFRNYILVILNRVNSLTQIRYKDDPFVFGWELANEPRSSDVSTRIISQWVAEMASHIKSIDSNHLVGTGEEGFDVTAAPYSLNSYNSQQWLFDGSTGVAFAANCVIPSIDFGSCHLYPESWNLQFGAGNAWIRDHIRIARAARKPLLLGEFGVRSQKIPTYDSWLTTSVLDNAAGAILWQMLEGPRIDREGFGVRCSEDQLLCSHLQYAASRFTEKSQTGSLPQPQGFLLQQNYPNPFNAITTIAYSLPFDAHVELAVFNILGQKVATLVEGFQATGERKELFDGEALASGSYFCKLVVGDVLRRQNYLFAETRKLVLIH